MRSDVYDKKTAEDVSACGAPSSEETAAETPGPSDNPFIPVRVSAETDTGAEKHSAVSGEWHSPSEERHEPDTEPGRKGRRIHAALIAVLLLFCVAGAGLFWYMLPSNRAGRLISRAAAHQKAMELIEAASDYREALRIMPESEEAQQGLYLLWSGEVTQIMELVDEERFREALDRARCLPQIDPERETMNHSALTVIYRQWAVSLAGNGDPGELDRLLADAASDLSAEEISDIRQSVRDILKYISLLRELDEESEGIIELSESGRAEDVFGRMTEFARKAEEAFELGGTNPYCFRAEGSDKGLALYLFQGDVQTVVGEIDEDGVPDGEATIYYAELQGEEGQYLYTYSCEWKNGRPNGYCIYRELGYDAEDASDDTEIKGNLVNGLWDGETAETYLDGETYYITYKNGIVEVISKDGPDSNVVGYNRDGTRMITFTDAAVSTELGVPFIYIY
ncbi:MAG: hypothetical protein IIY63_05595 [Oscillospiraceae bacterium]|nr:hypothetical protein [Oscillospiraceae bacterium]